MLEQEASLSVFQNKKENKDTFDPSTSSFSDIAAKFNSIFTDSITLSYLDTGSIGLNYIFGGGLPLVVG